jgi:hypothetical protein
MQVFCTFACLEDLKWSNSAPYKFYVTHIVCLYLVQSEFRLFFVNNFFRETNLEQNCTSKCVGTKGFAAVQLIGQLPISCS